MKITQTLFEDYKAKLGNQTLFNGVHNFTILNNSLAWTQDKYFKKWFGNSIPCISFSVAQDTKSTYWVTESHFNAISKEVFVKYWNDPTLIETLEKGRQEHISMIEKHYAELSPETIAALSPDELKLKLIDLNDHEGYANCNGWYSFGFEKEFVQQLLVEVGSTITSERLNEIWDTLTLPVSLSFDKRSALKVFNLLENGLTLDQLDISLQYLYAGFFGLPNLETVKQKIMDEYVAYSSTEIRSKLKQEILDELSAKQATYNTWLQTLSEDERKLAIYTKHIIAVRDSMRDTLGMTIAVIYRTLFMYSKKYNIPMNILDFCLFEELLQGGEYLSSIEKELLKRKNEGFAIYVNPSDGEIHAAYNAADNRNAMEVLFNQQHNIQTENVTQIKGVAASKGLVTGIVKVVVDLQADWHKMEEGDILVTGMTRPEFVPLMKIASAIITDEGGITCHAAIVSRELKIPCVIGTKHATKTLNDGDRVEVDANTGIVKILK